MKNPIQKSALSTNLIALVFVLCGTQLLHAQDDANLINVTTLDQLSAIRYDLDGDGVVVFTAENPLGGSAGNVDDLAELSRYESQFTGGTYHTRAAGSDTPISDASEAVVAGTTYVYKLSVTYEGYELMNDLDFKNSSTNTDEFSIWAKGSTASDPVAEGWDPIGYYNTLRDNIPFSAIFEGNRHTISNLFINRSSTNYVGLFGYVKENSAELRNIGLLDVEVTGDSTVGGLVGWNDDEGTVSNSYATGSVTARITVGGLVGSNKGDISGSYATGSVTGNNGVGGLVGTNRADIVSSYATGAVKGVGTNVGGLVGANYIGTVSNSYATGSVTGDLGIGGLMGQNQGGTISNSYATGSVTGNRGISGLVAQNDGGTVTASYYNRQTTGQSDTGKGEPKTTAALLTPTGYTGIYGSWDDGPDDTTSADDTDYWDFGTNGQYPVLKLDVDGNGTVGDAADLRAQRPLHFTQASYPFAILNTANINDVVGIVRAVPEDANNELTYSMDTSAKFSISSEAEMDNPSKVGQISVKAALSTNTYTLNVKVTEAGGGTATVEVRIKVWPLPDADSDGLIEVSTLDQLNAIRYDLNGDGAADNVSGETAYQAAFLVPTGSYNGYELMVNLDFEVASSYASNTTHTTWTTESGWLPIGYSNSFDNRSFSTIFEGNGHTISNLFINSLASSVGLFGYVRGRTAELRNIGLLDVKVRGNNNVGGLVGQNYQGTVSNSFATGSVTGENSVGGLVGQNYQGKVSNSYATGSVTGREFVGGLVGDSYQGTVSGSYATGSVTGDEDLGGLMGRNYQGTVSNSYATGSVTGNDDLGGLVGFSSTGTVTASYYNTETTGQNDIGKGEGKTTTDLLTPTGYTGIYQTWNNDTDYWDFGTNDQYPVLKLDVDGNGTVGDATDLRLQRPRLSVVSSSLDFGEVYIASTASTIRSYNLTGENLTGNVTLAIGGANAGLFVANMTTISPSNGAVPETTVTVTFTPTTAGGPFIAMITHSSGGLAPVIVNLTGTATNVAPTPTLEADRNSLNFGDVNTSSTPGIITYDLTGANLAGNVTLELGGTNAALFTISPTDPITPKNGAVSQQITVTFDPAVAQTYNAMITHSGGGLTTPLVVSLRGAGTLAATPTLQATPSSLDFREVNTASTTSNMMTYNLTGANLTGVVALTIEGTNANLFSLDMATISPAIGAILGTTVTVTFTPTTAGGPFTAMITHSGGGLAPVEVNLMGSAVSPTLASTENNLDFGDVSTASTTSNAMTYDLTGANLTEDVTLTITGANADLFTISPTDPIEPINGEVNQTITVTFDPTTVGGPFTAMITHSGGGLTSPLVVSLRGTGVSPPVLLGFATRAISNLRLSPNPVTGLLYVQGHGLGDMTVTVRSIAGKVHGSYTIRNAGKVPFSGLPSGMYIVQIVSQTGIVTKQIIKSSGL